MNKNILILTLGTSVALTGCDSLLYSNTMAPMFSMNNSMPQMTQAAPPILDQTLIPIEQPSRNAVVVKQAQSNPYGSLPKRPSNPVNVPKQVYKNTEIANPVSKIQDPRIREATEVLAAEDAANNAVETASNTANNTVSNAVEKVENAPIHPTQTVVERPVKAVKETVKERVSEATNSVKEQVQTAKETVSATQERATAEVEKVVTTTKKAVRPAPTTTKSATRALLQEAKGAVSAGQYDKAASALERAHRIEPGNAKILYDIAQIRYAQGKYRQASSFASKAATYSNSPALSKKVWSLLSKSRKQLGNNTGATAAAEKAASFQ